MASSTNTREVQLENEEKPADNKNNKPDKKDDKNDAPTKPAAKLKRKGTVFPKGKVPNEDEEE